MDERPTKRRGPLLWLAARSRRFWIAMALLPVLYVASSGPMRMVLIRWYLPNTMGSGLLPVRYDYWTPVYSPLIWFLEEFCPEWLGVLFWEYCDLFRVPIDS